MATSEHLFVGADLGTGGARVVAATRNGSVVARGDAGLPQPRGVCPEPLGHEQEPQQWWAAFRAATASMLAQLTQANIPATRIAAISIDGTSGTVVCLGAGGEPIRPALMHNDRRSQRQASTLNEIADSHCDRMGYRFDASFALSKMLWIREHEPALFSRTRYLAHHSDFVQWRLTGAPGISDYSNGLKTGFDLVDECWPEWMGELDGIPERLPSLVAPGRPVGAVSVDASRSTGLPAGTPVVSGATDGTAGALASGLRRFGDYNTTLGTTLIFKCLGRRMARHPEGLVYSHKLPGGRWLPGAASNTGGQWIADRYADADAGALDAAADRLLPTTRIAYPLVGFGERFPFRSAEARGFLVPASTDELEIYAAHLQGTALFERLCYEMLDDVVGTTSGDVFSTGGGSRSDVWMQCRSDATGRPYHRPRHPEAGFGAAILAAAGTVFGHLPEAIESMVQVEKTFEPNPATGDAYDEAYHRLIDEMRRRGYL